MTLQEIQTRRIKAGKEYIKLNASLWANEDTMKKLSEDEIDEFQIKVKIIHAEYMACLELEYALLGKELKAWDKQYIKDK